MNLNEIQKTNRKFHVLAIACGVLLISNFIFVGLYVTKKQGITANPYPLIDPARQIIAQSDYIINLQPLRQYLNDLVAKEKDYTIQLYYEQLNTGANININQDLRLPPASLAKLPLAIVVAKKIENGKWNWDDELILSNVDGDSASGDLYKQPVGTTISIHDLLMKLLIDSDNTAYNILGRNVDQDDLRPLIDETGLENLFDAEGQITAKEYSRVLRVLYTSDYLKRINSEQILEWMAQSTFKDYLSQGIPDGVRFAHKYGENKELKVLADSGIVYQGNRPYLLTVIIQPPDQSTTARTYVLGLMKTISQHVYDYGASTQ